MVDVIGIVFELAVTKVVLSNLEVTAGKACVCCYGRFSFQIGNMLRIYSPFQLPAKRLIIWQF